MQFVGAPLCFIPQAMPVEPEPPSDVDLDKLLERNGVEPPRGYSSNGRALPNYDAARILPPEAFESPVRTRGPPADAFADDSQDTLVSWLKSQNKHFSDNL